ncbi:MAG: hypothetical protein ABI847_16745 [Anaerolineales bacterium]
MSAATQAELNIALQLAQLTSQSPALAAHLSEIEAESETLLDLLTTIRAHAHHDDADATQEALAELVIALEHLLHHAEAALPALQKGLDIQPD